MTNPQQQNNQKPAKERISELEAEVDRLIAEAEERKSRFKLKEELTSHFIENMPRHVLFHAAFQLGLAERMTKEQIPLVIEYLCTKLPGDVNLIRAYGADMISYREMLDTKAQIDLANLAAKAKENPPTEHPQFNLTPAKVGTAE